MTAERVHWAGGTDTGPRRPRLRGVRHCDVAVVGAGLTGLAAALELAEADPDLRITVVEAEHVAAGASGRGTGLLGTRIGPALATARRRWGDDVARAAYLWSVDAVRHVLDLAARHSLRCDLTEGGQLIAAATDKGAAEQDKEAEAARALGLPVTRVAHAELPAFARGYRCGLRYTPAATLDPAALTRELARVAESRGVTIHEHSPVRGIRHGTRPTLTTADGEVSAGHVIVAAGAPGAALRAPAHVIGVRVQAAVTGRLPRDVLDELAALRDEPLIGHEELSPYFRLTTDGRLVVGGGAVTRDTGGAPPPLAPKLRSAVRALSPALAGVDVEAAWTGPIGMTRDGLPAVGRHRDDPRLLFAGGCNGHGLAVSVGNGAYLARWIVRGAQDDLPFSPPWVRPKAPWVPRGRAVDGLLDRYLAHLTAAARPVPAAGHESGGGRTGRHAAAPRTARRP